jgi:hypothetical protein
MGAGCRRPVCHPDTDERVFTAKELKVPTWVGWLSWLLTLPAWFAAYLNGRSRGRKFTFVLASAVDWDLGLWRTSDYAVPEVTLFWAQSLVWCAFIVAYFVGLAYVPEGWGLVPVNLVLLPLSIYSAVHLGTLSYRHGFSIGQRQAWLEGLAAKQFQMQTEAEKRETDERATQTLGQLRELLAQGYSLERLREAGWSEWIDHFKAQGITLDTSAGEAE